MTYTKRALLGATILTSVTQMVGTAATAQDTVETPLGRIVLGAGVNDAVAIDTPQAVTVIDQDEIDQAQATTAGGLLDLVPGVQAIGSGRVVGESFNIRGIGQLANADESRIIITVDGATKFYEQYRVGSFFSDPALYKQVEVLRGPASSTLYGAGALGGVINFETKDASDFLQDSDYALRTQLSYASNGDAGAASVIFAARPVPQFESLVALNYRQADDFVDGDGQAVAGSAFDALSGLAKAKLQFGDDGAQALTASVTRWQSDADDTQFSQTGTIAAFGTTDRDVTDDTLALRYENPFLANPLLDLEVVLSYAETAVSQYGSDQACGGFSTLFCDSDYAYQTTSLKVENTSAFGRGDVVTYLTAGLQLSEQDRLAETSEGSIGFHPEGSDARIGLYAQAEVIVDDRLTIIPGLRVDDVTLSAGGDLDFDGYQERAVSPKIAALYQFNDIVNVFGSVARTQRVPTIDEVFSTSANEPNSPDLGMETGFGREVGLSVSLQDVATRGDALDAKFTRFSSDLDNLIVRDPTPGTPYYQNVAAAEIAGVEFEAAYDGPAAFARIAYANIDGEDKDSGARLRSIPARSFVMSFGGKNERLGLRYGWQGSFFDQISYGPEPEDQFAAYNVQDLFVDWEGQRGVFEGVNVGLRAKNIRDTQYTNALAGDPGAGRSIELRVARSFAF